MISVDRFKELADEVADELPPEFFNKLNGGIILLDRAKLHPESRPEAPLYIMGEFSRSHSMGRHICLYYGSFTAVYRHLDEQAMQEEIRRVLYHEFTHHLESLSGLRTLEIRDAERLAEYRREHGETK